MIEIGRARVILVLALAANLFGTIVVTSNMEARAASNVVLTVSSQFPSGQAINGLYSTLITNSTLSSKGFTPVQYSIVPGASGYVVTVSNYKQFVFDHWQDTGATQASRSITLTKNTALVAIYRPATVVANPNSVAAGAQVSINGNYFASTKPITISFDNAPIATSPSPITSNNTGGFSATMVIPSTASPGTHVIAATDSSTSVTTSISVTTTALPWISLNPTTGSAASSVKISGGNFGSNSGITISFAGSIVTTSPVSIATDSTGAFSANFTVPSSAANGLNTVSARDSQSHSANATFTVSGTVQLNVVTQDTHNNPISGLWTVLSQGANTIGSGFSPIAYTLNNGVQYSIGVGNYGKYFFDHWLDTGTSVDPRAITLNSNTQLVAVYRVTTLLISPASGPSGTTVTLNANAFTPNHAITVTFDGSAMTTSPASIISNSTGGFSATFMVPSSAGVGGHTVSSSDGTLTASQTFTVGGTSVPSIVITPSSGPDSINVNVTGSNFTPNSQVTIKFDSIAVSTTPSTVTSTSAGSFSATFKVPSNAGVGAHTINATDASALSASASFAVPSSSIGLNPNSGVIGTTVTVSGSNFAANSAVTVKFDGVAQPTSPASPVTGPTGAFSATFNIPSGASIGSHTISAIDGSQNSANAIFSVSTTATLTVQSSDIIGRSITGYYTILTSGSKTVATGFTPKSFTLNGSQVYSVGISNYGVYSFDHWSDNNSTVEPRSISITSNTIITAVFANSAVHLTPARGPVGTQVAVTGNHFTANSKINISLDGSPIATSPSTVTTDSAGSFSGVTFAIPASAANGQHKIIVSDSATHPVSYGALLTVGPNAAISIFPSSVHVGDSIRITGTNFAPSSTVTVFLDGVQVTNNPGTDPLTITTASDGSFVGVVEIPLSAAGGHTLAASDSLNDISSQQYTVQPSAYLSPPIGRPGTTITIQGGQATGFAANSTVSVSLDSTPLTTTPSPATTDSTGDFGVAVKFSIPSVASVGVHQLTLQDAVGNVFTTPYNVTSNTTPLFNAQLVLNIPTNAGLTQMSFIPDNGPSTQGSGSLMINGKNGTVYVIKYTNGQYSLQQTPFVNIRPMLIGPEDAGLLGLAIDPNWVTTKQVYVYYTVNNTGTFTNQVVRYTSTTDGSGNIVAVPSSAQLIIGGIPAQTTAKGSSHNGGHLKFDAHGNLYISTGDNFLFTPAQDLTTLNGKLLRITPLATPDGTGKFYSIPSSNPFASSSNPSIRKEIFSYGLRNPQAFDIDPVSGNVFLNDVGYNSWESFFNSTSPANFGWPNYEAAVIGNPAGLSNYVEPVYWYTHNGVEPTTGPTANLLATTGATFYHGYNGTSPYPAQFEGAYFFGDFGAGFIKAILPFSKYPQQIDPTTGVPIGQVQTVLTGIPMAPIDMAVWHGKVFYIDLFGNLKVLNYS